MVKTIWLKLYCKIGFSNKMDDISVNIAWAP